MTNDNTKKITIRLNEKALSKYSDDRIFIGKVMFALTYLSERSNSPENNPISTLGDRIISKTISVPKDLYENIGKLADKLGISVRDLATAYILHENFFYRV